MPGKLLIIGIGPGAPEHLTPAARRALEISQAVVGYQPYLDLIHPLIEGREIHATGMTRERERCLKALELAASGKITVLVSSGDPGVYGMAGLALELLGEFQQPVEVEIVPGISAVMAAAARLGAPLMHDFAVISMSDLLTPWGLIRRRLEAAAGADFVTALYNPRSRGRTTHLGEARWIFLQKRSPSTPVGIVRNACRPEESIIITDLQSLADREREVDMRSLVIIGNSSTFLDKKGWMITPRGYDLQGRGGGNSGTEKGPESDPEMEKNCHSARTLFVGGTGSDVGKSVIAAGLCRILKRRGFSVAPFKAQNMALNSAVTPEGGEIGRAQALQAVACGLSPHVDMNPVLLKPNSEMGSQVIVHGRPVANMSVKGYHAFKKEAFGRIEESFRRLAAAHEVIILEGAGSIAEINLREHDIVNLRCAAMAGAPVLLVADIDRGGVFAAVAGTFELLQPEERARIAGVVINRFRGDPDLLRPGIRTIEERTGVPVFGVVPWLDLRLPEEDSVTLARRKNRPTGSGVRIGVIRLPHIANYTDFDPLEREAGVDLLYLDDPQALGDLDLLILPGTKNTLSDLRFLEKKGLGSAIRNFRNAGGMVVGICGGYQMLGQRVRDPEKIESDFAEMPGLGLLDVETLLLSDKETHLAQGVFLDAASAGGFTPGETVSGYEIHMGSTRRGPSAAPLLRLTSRSGKDAEMEDGTISGDGRVWGSYLHGFFENEGVRRAVLERLRLRRGLPVPPPTEVQNLDRELSRLADHLEAHLDIDGIFRCMGLKRGSE